MKYKVKNIGNTLKESRKRANLTMKVVAENLDITSGYISRIENGSSEPSLDTLIKLASIYQINIEDLIDVDSINLNLNNDILDLRNALINHPNVKYLDKNLNTEDKLTVLRFLELITSCNNPEYKSIISSTLRDLTKINELLKEN